MDIRVGAALAAALVTSLLGCSDPNGPTIEPFGARIVVVREGDIQVFYTDGTPPSNLTNKVAVYGSMDLSPDGQWVVFYSNRDNCSAVWKVKVDGSSLVNLTPGDFSTVRCNQMPRWSPDGSKILFNTSRNNTYSAYVMNADGSNPHNVSTGYDAAEGGGVWPAGWTPDGRVVWHKLLNGIQDYVANADGSNIQPLFGRTGDHSPVWSPDGSKVVFIRTEGSLSDVWVADANGANATRLTPQSGSYALDLGSTTLSAMRPWSPDGKWVVFYDGSFNQAAIEVVNIDGTGRMRLTEASENARFNSWSPDGRITFHAAVNGKNDIFVIKRDKTGRVNLTNTANTDETLALWLK